MNPFSILIVDDEDALRESIAFDFRRKKFNVLTANCGQEAMKVLENQRVDVVLSDVRMPNGTGLELLDWIKNRDVFMPVLMFITAYADVSIADAYDRGADAVFSKPFDRKALHEAVMVAVTSLGQGLRRGGTRVDTEIATGLKFLGLGSTVDCKTRNLGRGGFFVALDGPFPVVGDEAEFRMAVGKDNVEVVGRGVVRWVRRESSSAGPAGCGIEFTVLSERSREEIFGVVNFIKTKSYIPLK